MISLTILTLILIILLVVTVAVLSVFGAGFLIIFGDVIVLILALGWLIKKKIFKK